MSRRRSANIRHAAPDTGRPWRLKRRPRRYADSGSPRPASDCISCGADGHRLAEFLDEWLDALQDVVDVLRARRAAERAPYRAHRPVDADTHRDQDVRGLDVPRGTRRAGGDRDALQVEAEHDRLRLHVAEQKARRAGKPLGGMPGEPHLRDPCPHAVPEPVAERRDARRLALHVTRPHLDRLAEADDPGDVLGTGPPAPLVLAAVLDSHHLGALPDKDAGGALRAVD